MNYVLVFVIAVVVLLLTMKSEGFTEAFGFSGYTKPTGSVKMNDPRPDLSNFREVEASVDNDMIEEFVLLANDEISKRTGVCTYIIETTKVQRYVGKDKEVYECMFMAIKKGGFSFGFSVVASYEIENGKVKLVSLRSQPIGVEAPDDVSPFVEGSGGKEFIDYQLVKEVAIPTKGEFEKAKNKLQ